MGATATGSLRSTQLLRDGFALLREFVAVGELTRLRAETQSVLARPLPSGCERPHNTLAPLRWNDPIVEHLLGSDRRLEEVADAIGARDLRWISGYISVKQPRSHALWWHQDWWCWDHPVSYRSEATQVAVLCYLTPTSRENGALRVLPGTHHRSVPLHASLPEAHTHGAGELADAHPAMTDHADQMTLALDAGDAVVVDYRLLHGTHANMSARRRDCLLLSFVPSWSDLPTDLQAHLIRHPALPTAAERAAVRARQLELMPSFDGVPRDLELNRSAPAEFAATGSDSDQVSA